MMIDSLVFSLIVSVALLIVVVTPIALIYMLFIDWKRKDLW